MTCAEFLSEHLHSVKLNSILNAVCPIVYVHFSWPGPSTLQKSTAAETEISYKIEGFILKY